MTGSVSIISSRFPSGNHSGAVANELARGNGRHLSVGGENPDVIIGTDKLVGYVSGRAMDRQCKTRGGLDDFI